MKEKCHICGRTENELFICRTCGNPVCYHCTMPYNQFTQIDYDLCTVCGDVGKSLMDEMMHELFEARKKYKSERLTDEQRLAVVERKLKRQERLTKLNKLFGDDSV